jgi:tetratricopeptide (TPR) repeat protein
VQAAAGAPENKRTAARLDLARFYLGRELFPEAKAVLEVAVAEGRPTAEQPSGLMLRAIAKILMDRSSDALTDLSNPILDQHQDAPLWRAFALARQSKWSDAREGFRNAEAAIRTLPIELQRAALREQLRVAVEVRDYSEAAQALNDLQTIGVPNELHPSVSVLAGRLHEGLGRISDALTSYRVAMTSPDLPAAAQGRLRELLLRYSLKEMTRAQLLTELESLTTVWRGDETEIEALSWLARMYIEEQRYRDAFFILRTALAAHPNSPITRHIQDDATATFEKLFLGGGADTMPPIEALSLFYDFRDLTPAGRRGDEMIRRLADRLVAVDLLGQATELLQHQVDNRLQGAARAQTATRLAVIYLMNRKPDRAFQVLRATRAADLSNELRHQRLLIEARALSDTGRHDLALEVIANLSGREVERLRADILWSARRWREAGEQLERLYGERWREFTPLNDSERPDILRAAIGLALGEDQLGVDRMREKYGPKMADGPLARAFDVVTTPFATSGPEFRAIAKGAAAADTLDQFLRDMRSRYPEMSAAPPAPPVPPAPLPEPQSRTAEPKRATSGSSG